MGRYDIIALSKERRITIANKLRKIFCPTKAEEIEQLNRYKEIVQSIPDGECDNCKYCIGPDPSLPGFVTDFGECEKNMEFYDRKICHFEEITCPYYEKDNTFINWCNEKIKELQRCLEQNP